MDSEDRVWATAWICSAVVIVTIIVIVYSYERARLDACLKRGGDMANGLCVVAAGAR